MNVIMDVNHADVNANSITNLPAVIQVCSTNQAPLSQRYRKAHDDLRRYDQVVASLEYGTRQIALLTLKSMVYFAIACISDPTGANTLKGWGEIDIPGNANPYLRPMKYVAQGTSSSSLRTKLNQWASIAQHVAAGNIPEDKFLHVAKHHGGIDRWYRKLPKQGSKGGRPKGYSPNCQPGGNKPALGSPQVRDVTSDIRKGLKIADKVLYDSIPVRSEAGRELVCVLFDITESACFADVNALIARLRVLSEYVGVVGTANQSVASAADNTAADRVAA